MQAHKSSQRRKVLLCQLYPCHRKVMDTEGGVGVGGRPDQRFDREVGQEEESTHREDAPAESEKPSPVTECVGLREFHVVVLSLSRWPVNNGSAIHHPVAFRIALLPHVASVSIDALHQVTKTR